MPNDSLVPDTFDPNAPLPSPEQTDNGVKATDPADQLVSQEPDSAYDATGNPVDVS